MAVRQVLLCLLVLSVFTDATRTKIYKDTKNKNSLYDKSTFGFNLYADPLRKVNNNINFRNYINSRQQCVGDLCIEGSYKCSNVGSKKCYHVEHIIDINGKEFQNCPACKNIAANRVMANGQWNSALGSLAKNSYESSISEKILVYGKDNVDMARYYINKCCYGTTGLHETLFILTDNITDVTYNDLCDMDADCSCDEDSLDADCGCDCNSYIDNQYKQDNTNLYIISSILSVTIMASIAINAVLYIRYKKNRYISSIAL